MYQYFFKRLFDFIVAFLLLLLLFPLMLLVGLLVAIKMGRPVIFSHTRSGRNQKPFKVYKFRSMIDAPDLSDSERITQFGLLLRKLSLDELPQLFNVLKGDMSLIGPRPLLPEYDSHYSTEQLKRFMVRPGVSGLAQVNGRNGLTWEQKFAYDVEYVDRLSFLLDFKILLKTVVVVFRSAGFSPAGEEKKFSDK
ncbi:sugar transferase [Neptuniibacter sp. SY11_33]|uniref:sugar transferase n=1 Tax=Neptuniibacter sp. SY11_33 TaxID=3398215 RepID=UPI0039F619CC